MTTLLSVFGILLAIGTIAFVVQLHARVENLEQRCARYEVIFEQLHRTLATTTADDFLGSDSEETNIPGEIGDESLPDHAAAFMAHKVSPLTANSDTGNLSVSSRGPRSSSGDLSKFMAVFTSVDRDQFDQFVHEVRLWLLLGN